MQIGERIKALFAKPKVQAAPAEVAWAESPMYSSTAWPRYNPDDLLSRQGYKIYQRMMIDEQIKAVVRFKRDAITSRRWYFEYEADDAEQTKMAEILTAIIRRMPGSFNDCLNGVMSAMYAGYSISEKVLEPIIIDGKTWIGIKKIAQKPFQSFFFYTDEYGNIERFVQRIGIREQEIDLNQFIYHVQNKDVDSIYGQSELREAYRSWFSKDMLIRFWNIHLERHASGFVWAQPKDGATITAGTRVHTDLTNMLSNLSATTGILMPANVDLNFVSPANTDAYERAIASHDKAIAKALLVPNLLGISEQGETGSYSQSQTQLEAFLWTLEAEAARLEETLNEQLFRPLCEINFGGAEHPRFRFKPISESMKHQTIMRWKDLIQAGAVDATDTDAAHLRELLEFPEAGEPLRQSVSPSPKLGNESEQEPASGNQNDEETIIGREQLKSSRRIALSRAIRRVDFAVIDNKTTQLAATATESLLDVMKAGLADITADVVEKNIIDHPDKIMMLQFSARTMTKLRKAIIQSLRSGWELGKDHARTELLKTKLVRRDFTALSDAAADKFFEARSHTIAGDLATNARKKVANVIYNGIKGEWSIKEIVDQIEEDVGADVLSHIGTVVRTTTFEAVNEARYSMFTDPDVADFVEALEYSAVMDGKTTPICEYMDGHIHPADDEVWTSYRPPLHFNCRSLLVAVTINDTWEESEDPTMLPEPGFGGA